MPKMLMFTLSVSCLTTSNLPWFVDLTFQVPMQYCSLQHRSLLFTWAQTMVEVMKIMLTSLRRSHACTATVCAPNPAAGHPWPTPSLEILGHPQASPGQSPVGSLFLSPGSWCTRFCCAFQECISQSCVSSGSSMMGFWWPPPRVLMPYPHPDSLSLRQTTAILYLHRRCSDTVLSVITWIHPS